MYSCETCGAVYLTPTVCVGSPVIDGAVSDYKKELHEPVGCGLVKNEETGEWELGEAA